MAKKIEKASPPPRAPCQFCGKALVAIGRQRRGGAKHHDDWPSRTSHKACWLVRQPQKPRRAPFKLYKRRR